MAFTGRTRDAIRDALLVTWAAEYTANGERLLIAPGSDAYLWATALAVQLEGLEAQAEAVARDILPDQASAEALARHGYVDGVARGAGRSARHSVTVTSTVDATYFFPTGVTYQMTYSDGTRYDVNSTQVTITAGVGVISITADDFGEDGTRATGDVLTFVSTPTGLNPTGTVAAGPVRVEGTDVESIEAWAARIILQRQERPGSGNRSQWRAWVEEYTGTDIATAYVYPLLQPPASYPGAGTPNTLGCVTTLAVGPAQGDDLVNTRIVPSDDGSTRAGGARLTLIEDYIEGDRDAAGDTTDIGTQLRPVTLTPENYSIEQIAETPRDVVLSCTMNAANAFPWTGALTITISGASSVTVSGNHVDKAGKLALVLPAIPTVRGEYRAVILGTPNFSAGDTTFTQAVGQEVGSPGGSVYPCPPNWNEIRTAVFAHFDGLGPGDTTPPSRWPPEESGARATFYRTGLAADVITDVTSVLSCTVPTPAADVTPAAKTVVTLGSLLVTP